MRILKIILVNIFIVDSLSMDKTQSLIHNVLNPEDVIYGNRTPTTNGQQYDLNVNSYEDCMEKSLRNEIKNILNQYKLEKKSIIDNIFSENKIFITNIIKNLLSFIFFYFKFNIEDINEYSRIVYKRQSINDCLIIINGIKTRKKIEYTVPSMIFKPLNGCEEFNISRIIFEKIYYKLIFPLIKKYKKYDSQLLDLPLFIELDFIIIQELINSIRYYNQFQYIPIKLMENNLITLISEKIYQYYYNFLLKFFENKINKLYEYIEKNIVYFIEDPQYIEKINKIIKKFEYSFNKKFEKKLEFFRRLIQ